MSSSVIVGSANEIQDAWNYAGSKNRTLEIMPGVYDIASTLVYNAASSGVTTTIRAAGKAGRGPTGVLLRWTGAAGGVIMNLRGANNALIYGLAFDPYTNYGIGSLFLEELNSEGGPGSSGVSVEHCHITGGYGAGSYGIRIGDNHHQVSEVAIRDTSISGGATSRFGVITNSSNTKNFIVAARAIQGFDYGICHGEPTTGSGSGFMLIDGVSFANSRVSDVWAQSGNSVAIRGGGSEGSARLFDCAGAGPGSHPIEISNFYFASSTVPADDAVIKFDGQLRISGCHLRNMRAPTSEARIVCGAGSLAAGKNAIQSRGNYYLNSIDRPPFYDTAGGSIFAGRDSNYVGKVTRVISEGDIGGAAATPVALRAINGDPPSCSRYAMEEVSLGIAGITYPVRAEGAPPRHMATVTYEAFNAAAAGQTRALWTMAKGTSLTRLVAHIRVPFAGVVGPLALSCGRTTNATEFILAHDATVVGRKGLLPGDRGASLTDSLGYSDWDNGTQIKLRLTGGANLGDGTATLLTAGEVDIYAVTEVVG